MSRGPCTKALETRRDPSPGAFVSILSSAGHLLATTRADRHGRYQFSQMAPGRYFVTASRPGYFVSRAGGRAGVRLAIECSKNCLPSEADIELVRGSVLTGLVVDASGEPVERAKVSMNRAASRQSLLNAIDDWTDDRGRFRIAGLRPGSYLVSVRGGALGAGASSARETLDLGIGQVLDGLRFVLGGGLVVQFSGRFKRCFGGEGLQNRCKVAAP